MRTSVPCATTGAFVAINIKDDPKAMTRAWGRSHTFQCPHCDQKHVVKYRDAYVEGVLSGFEQDFGLKVAP
jgi:hypothetical protein